MAVRNGSYSLADLRANRFTSVASFGLDTINDILQRDNANHNTIVNELMTELAEPTTDRQRIYGTSSDNDMQETDEFSQIPTIKNSTGSTVAFPLKSYQFAIGWTEKYMKRATVGEFAEQAIGAQVAHLRMLRREIKKALFLSTNYTQVDKIGVPSISLAVKRLVNADSQGIPNGLDGTSFTASSHTHYVARVSTFAASDLTAAINNLIEHGHGGRVIVAVHYNDAATVQALTGFVAPTDPRVVYTGVQLATTQPTNPGNLYNRFLGIFGAAEVWVKPWAIQNYLFLYDSMGPKPLAMRQDTIAEFQGLRVAAENSEWPLFAKYMEAIVGFGVWTRTNGVVLYIGATSYADPTITL